MAALAPRQPRPYPSAIDAERALLGAILQRQELLEQLARTDDAFYRPEHRKLYATMRRMHERGEEVDAVTVPILVEQSRHPDDFGGMAYVAELPDFCVSVAAAPHYAEIVRQAAAKRRLLTVLEDAAGRARDEDADALCAELRRALDQLDGSGGSSWRWYDALAGSVAEQERRIASGFELVSMPTGLVELDARLGGGLPRGGLVILAGRTGMGKSALALEIAHGACSYGCTVGFSSMEMPADEVVMRSLARFAGVGMGDVRGGRLRDDQVLDEAVEQATGMRLAVIDKPGLSLARLVSEAHALHREAKRAGDPGLDLLVVDYLQLCDVATGGRDANRAQAVADLAQGLKNLALSLRCVVIALSQLSRAVESRQKKHPQMSDLRDSGGIEQAADLVLLLYRDEYYNANSEHLGIVEVDVAKNRNGRAGWLHPVCWDPAESRWWEMEPAVAQDWERRRHEERGR
jgi:replicative DNA helicase